MKHPNLKRLIYLVDSSITIQKRVQISLADAEYELMTFDSAAAMLAACGPNRPSLFVLRVHDAAFDALELCRSIRNSPDIHSTPVILAGEARRAIDPVRLKELGANDFLEFPFGSEALIAAIERCR